MQRNLQVDDIVIIKDESLPRNRWKLGRVDETYPNDDGLIRKVRVVIATDSLDDSGRPTKPVVHLERPVQKVFYCCQGIKLQTRESPPRSHNVKETITLIELVYKQRKKLSNEQ